MITTPQRLCRGLGSIPYASVLAIGGTIARAERFEYNHTLDMRGLAIYLLVAIVSHLISCGMAQTLSLEPQENAITSGLLGIANRVSCSVQSEALDKINLHCETAFGIAGSARDLRVVAGASTGATWCCLGNGTARHLPSTQF